MGRSSGRSDRALYLLTTWPSIRDFHFFIAAIVQLISALGAAIAGFLTNRELEKLELQKLPVSTLPNGIEIPAGTQVRDLLGPSYSKENLITQVTKDRDSGVAISTIPAAIIPVLVSDALDSRVKTYLVLGTVACSLLLFFLILRARNARYAKVKLWILGPTTILIILINVVLGILVQYKYITATPSETSVSLPLSGEAQGAVLEHPSRHCLTSSRRCSNSAFSRSVSRSLSSFFDSTDHAIRGERNDRSKRSHRQPESTSPDRGSIM